MRSAMPIGKARALCPHGIFVSPRMQRYYEKSKEIMGIFQNFSPDIQQLSIDEAFLDMSGTERMFGNTETAARLLKKTVFEQTGLRVSVGAASNKYIAKIASGKSKPDGLLLVSAGREAVFMRSLCLADIWGIGAKTRARLVEAGLTGIADILAQDRAVLQALIGQAAGSFLYCAVRGDMAHVFNEQRKSHSISTERTFETDLHEKSELSDALFQLSAELMCRILDEGLRSRTVFVKIRYADFTTISAQQSGALINDSADLYERVHRLFFARFDAAQSVRLIGIGVQADGDTGQLDLFASERSAKRRKLEQAVLGITKKNKTARIMQARLLPQQKDEAIQ